jgi:hypothetical protein
MSNNRGTTEDDRTLVPGGAISIGTPTAVTGMSFSVIATSLSKRCWEAWQAVRKREAAAAPPGRAQPGSRSIRRGHYIGRIADPHD